MKRWGRLSGLLALGFFVAAGCGGRTGGFSDGFDQVDGGANGNGGRPTTGGASSMAGRPARGGASSQAGSGGVYSVGGGLPTGGAYGYGGVYAYGGAYAGGAFPVGGTYGNGGAYPIAGSGYGGNPVQPGGQCCEASMEPSCRPRAVAKCVCGVAPYCCEEQWDEGCARLVEPLGCGYCEFDCQSCLNRACGGLLTRCFSDLGCVSIFSCVQQTGCHPFECYTPAQCGGVIDAWGGPASYSMGLLLQTFACSVQSGCDCN
jgi:hypothetical protein